MFCHALVTQASRWPPARHTPHARVADSGGDRCLGDIALAGRELVGLPGQVAASYVVEAREAELKVRQSLRGDAALRLGIKPGR